MVKNSLKMRECFDVDSHFGFGENWAAYAAHITESKIDKAIEGFSKLVPHEKIKNATMLDIGSGSGLHALSALKLGAEKVTAIDFDPNSVRTTKETLEKFFKAPLWDVSQANILAPENYEPLQQKYDVVYSWGVLHHTGDMWSAIRNAACCVNDHGLLVIAIYNRSALCGVWQKEKRFYTSLPKALRWIVDYPYAACHLLAQLLMKRNPVRYVREYSDKRGMRFMNDIRDWLGGYPYQSASEEELVNFIEPLGFKLMRCFDTAPPRSGGVLGTACGEYVFQRS